VPGSSKLDLTPLNVTAIGTVSPNIPGTLTLTLYGNAKREARGDESSPNGWLALSSSVAEPIGGEGELPETMWMIRGKDLMIFPGSGKMQGTFESNVADNPQPALNLDQHPTDITEEDPLYVFAVGASFAPTGGADTQAEGDSLATVVLHSLTLSA
jgi:hypothetical protein